MKIVRSFTATEQELEMLEAVAQYHGCSKSSTITNLLKKEVWRCEVGYGDTCGGGGGGGGGYKAPLWRVARCEETATK